jgi:hypothetical protein
LFTNLRFGQRARYIDDWDLDSMAVCRCHDKLQKVQKRSVDDLKERER